jgi:hypothetical protein
MNRQRWEKYDHASALLPRFQEKFIPEPNSGCWLWMGAVVPDGYGSFGISTKQTMKAHRVSWLLYRGAIPPQTHVLHHCDTRCCVNPDHLFLGDNAANVADRVAKGRSWSKLTTADDLKILEDDRVQSVIANDYDVTQQTICRAKQRAAKC